MTNLWTADSVKKGLDLGVYEKWEDEILLREWGSVIPVQLSGMLPGRSVKSVTMRGMNLQKLKEDERLDVVSMVQTPAWSHARDTAPRGVIVRRGDENWEAVAEELPEFSAEDCRARWGNLKRTPLKLLPLLKPSPKLAIVSESDRILSITPSCNKQFR